MPYTLIFSFLKGAWKEIALALLVAAAIGYVWHLRSTVASQKVTITQQADKIKSLADDIKLQNDAVDKMKKDSDARLAAAKQALDAAQKQAKVHTQRATDINRAVPSVPTDLCKSASDLIDQELNHE